MTLRRLVRWTVVLIPLALLTAGVVAYWMSDSGCDQLPGAPPSDPMQAWIYCDYGPPDVVSQRALVRPAPAEGELLVRVRAAAVNPLDWHYMRGTPYVMRLDTGLRKPASMRLSVDYAGTVEAVGAQVTQFKPGDEVFGGRTGAFAQYLTVRADRAVVLKPAVLTFAQAAAVPVAALTALQAVRDRGGVGPGTTVLINGASGGVGTFAVQIAKHLGAEVTGVCSTRNVELVRSLGADHVIDYTKESYPIGSQRYDVVIDNVGNHPLSANRRVMVPGGRYVLVGGGGPEDHPWLGPLPRAVAAAMLSWFVSQDMGAFLSDMSKGDLETLRGLLEAGAVTPVIDRQYAFSQLPEALRYLEQGRARGKVVITMP